MSRYVTTPVRRSARRLLAAGLYAVLTPYLPFAVLDELVAAAGITFRHRLYPPHVTLWAMVAQALNQYVSDRAAVDLVAAWMQANNSPRSGAYAAARRRLPLRVITAAAQAVAARAPATFAALRDRRVFVIDGSSLALDDTKANQAAYPQHVSQKPGCGFPTLYFVALMDHATGCVIDMAFGDVHDAEGKLLLRLLRHLAPGDIVIVDRGLASCPLIDYLHRLGINMIGRQHQSRKNLAPFSGDIDEHWETFRTRATASWWPLPRARSLRVRVVHAALGDGKALVINTLLTEDQVSARTLADLYRSRWRIETLFADIKTTLRLDHVRAKTPEAAHKAIWAHALAYNLVQSMLLDVAASTGEHRNRLSFKGALDVISASLRLARRTVRAARQWVIAQIARSTNPDRPGRNEPRVTKKRPKRYAYMTHTRDYYREHPHRGKPS
jgi:IS4 transposase